MQPLVAGAARGCSNGGFDEAGAPCHGAPRSCLSQAPGAILGRSARLLLLGAILGRCARRWRGLLTRLQRHAERRGLLPQVAGSVPRGLRGCAGRRLDRPIRAAPGPAQP